MRDGVLCVLVLIVFVLFVGFILQSDLPGWAKFLILFSH